MYNYLGMPGSISISFVCKVPSSLVELVPLNQAHRDHTGLSNGRNFDLVGDGG